MLKRMLDTLVDLIKFSLHINNLISTVAHILLLIIVSAWSRWWSARQDHIQTLFKLEPCSLLINMSFLLNHELTRQSLVDSDLLIELAVELLDLLIKFTLIHRCLDSRILF